MKKKARKKFIGNTESYLEEAFLIAWNSRFPQYPPTTQHRFVPKRLYRFDFAWLHCKVAVEIQGRGPGHDSMQGVTKDNIKQNLAVQFGWRVLYFRNTDLTPKYLTRTLNSIAKVMGINYGDTYGRPRHYLDQINLRRRGKN